MEHSSNKGIILILSILFIVVMMIPITGLIIAPSEINWLEQPRYELGGMTLNEIFVDNAQYLETKQLFLNGDFDTDTTGWTPIDIGIPAVASGIVSFTATAVNAYLRQTLITVVDSKYYSSANIKTTSLSVGMLYSGGLNVAHSGGGDYELLSNIVTAGETAHSFGIIDTRASAWTQTDVDYVYSFNISTLITNNQYSPLFYTTFDLMSDADIKTQMDLWVTEGIDILNIWLTYNAVGLDHILSYDEMLDYYQLYLSYL